LLVNSDKRAVPGSEPEPPTRELAAGRLPESETRKRQLGLAASLARNQQRLGFRNSVNKPQRLTHQRMKSISNLFNRC
jgi:hypothetical protein